MKFSVVTHKNNKEIGRSDGMEFEQALKIVKLINKTHKDIKSYVEETLSVKHLPITVKSNGK